jgi:hypothetical protein
MLTTTQEQKARVQVQCWQPHRNGKHGYRSKLHQDADNLTGTESKGTSISSTTLPTTTQKRKAQVQVQAAPWCQQPHRNGKHGYRYELHHDADNLTGTESMGTGTSSTRTLTTSQKWKEWVQVWAAPWCRQPHSNGKHKYRYKLHHDANNHTETESMGTGTSCTTMPTTSQERKAWVQVYYWKPRFGSLKPMCPNPVPLEHTTSTHPQWATQPKECQHDTLPKKSTEQTVNTL